MRTKNFKKLPIHSVKHEKYCPYCGDLFFTTNRKAKFCCDACKDTFNSTLRSKPELKGLAKFNIPISLNWLKEAKAKIEYDLDPEDCGCGCQINDLTNEEVDRKISELNYFFNDNFCNDCMRRILCSIIAGKLCVSMDEEEVGPCG